MSYASNSVHFIGVLVLALAADRGHGEDAVDLAGRRYRGELILDNGAWVFQPGKDKSIPVGHLSSIRFAPNAACLPKVPLTKALLLSAGERLTGGLVRIDEKTIRFTASWGQTFTLERASVVGVEHADRWLPLFRDDRTAPLQGWKTARNVAADPKETFFGNPSIRLDAPGQQLSRRWQPLVGEGRVSFVFRRSPGASDLIWNVELLPYGGALVIDKDAIRCANTREMFGSLKRDTRWHGLAVERRRDVIRFFVDDYCLGQTPIAPTGHFEGIRISAAGAAGTGGALWMEEFSVAKRLAATPAPANETRQDAVCLVHDEQLFGRLLSADDASVTLDAKFGKRTLPWTQLRGIGFATVKQKVPVGSADIYFLPGLGLSADCLRAKLIRWNESKLLVDHALLGEIAIERAVLDKILFEVK